MTNGTGRANVLRLLAQGLAVACLLVPRITVAQGLTGALIGTVTDAAGGVISGAVVRISSPALIGGELTTKTDERGQLRFPSVPPGSYALEIVLEGFRPYRDADIRIGAGATIERTPVLTLAALADSIVVHGSGSRLDARNPGFGTRFGAEDLDAIPMRRFSYQDWVKTAPGISPTSPSGSSVLVSAFGSGVDQNQYLLDGTSITATGNGVSRADPGVDFIQELQIQSVGASVEYGNVQGAVVNVITKSGGNRFQYDAAYYCADRRADQPAGAARVPIVRGNWTAATSARSIVTSRPASVARSSANDCGSSPDTSTFATPTVSRAPIRIFRGNTSRTRSSRSSPGAWLRAGSWCKAFTMSSGPTPKRRRRRSRAMRPSASTRRCRRSISVISLTRPHPIPSGTSAWDGSASRRTRRRPRAIRRSPIASTSPKTSGAAAPSKSARCGRCARRSRPPLSHYRAGWFGADHEWRMGAQVDRGEHRAVAVLPTGESSVYRNGVLTQRTLQAPANSGGRFVTAAVFVSDALRLGGRVTINPGLRFDHSRAISQDVPEFDALVHETGRTIEGRGTVDTWNIVSPRVGVVIKLDTDGRTMLRANAGRFSQGLLTGEISCDSPRPDQEHDHPGTLGCHTRA